MALLAWMAAVAVGCGPSFTSEKEELAYLQRIANPTPQQFQRQQELERHPNDARERATKSAAIAEQAEADRRKTAKEAEERRSLDERIANRARRERGATPETANRLAFLRSEAQRTEKRGAYSVSAIWLKDLLTEFPQVPDRLEIEQRITTLQSKPNTTAGPEPR